MYSCQQHLGSFDLPASTNSASELPASCPRSQKGHHLIKLVHLLGAGCHQKILQAILRPAPAGGRGISTQQVLHSAREVTRSLHYMSRFALIAFIIPGPMHAHLSTLTGIQHFARAWSVAPFLLGWMQTCFRCLRDIIQSLPQSGRLGFQPQAIFDLN